MLEGNYDIRKVPGTLGGVIIDRGHVTLAGQGAGTRLKQAAGQDTNVIRIIGSDVGHVTIRDLSVDANRAENDRGLATRTSLTIGSSSAASRHSARLPAGPTAAADCHDVTVRNCWVKDAHRLGIMLEGPNMRVLDNVLGNAGSDAVEILTGPGVIRGNLVEITAKTHVAIGSDRANDVIMGDNVVCVKKGGKLDIAFRSWAGSVRHTLTGNVLTVEDGGSCGLAMDLRGTRTAVTGNVLNGGSAGARLLVGGGHTTITGNVFENVQIEIDDTTGEDAPVLFGFNALDRSKVEVKRGRLLRAAEKE